MVGKNFVLRKNLRTEKGSVTHPNQRLNTCPYPDAKQLPLSFKGRCFFATGYVSVFK